MSGSMSNESLIATLENSLRSARNAQQRCLVRLRELEEEAERIRQEAEAYEKSAEQTEAAIYSLLATMRTGNQPPRQIANLRIDEDYELPSDLRRFRQRESEQSGAYDKDSRVLEDYARISPDGDSGDSRGGRSVPAITQKIEPISQRFADRTITQACTLILRESGEPLHVNELYNLLVSGGFEFKGNNPTISIAVSLNRNRRFRKVAPGTFDLVMREASKAS
ncbi:MAG: hypothetical protein IPM63_03755 [Acidobacteriota bacterium]|nr:MAG: hypothetical protein IPM63_03755 [Acidobacteriota bacterium]